MAIWTFRELPLFNFDRLVITWPLIIHSSQNLWPFQFVETFHVQFRGCRYLVHVNRISEWNVIAIWLSRELPLFNFEHLDISWASIIHSSQKLWPFELFESFRCSILTVWLYHGRRSYVRVKSYGHLNFSKLPLFNFKRLDISWASIIHSSQKLWPFELFESFRCSILTVWLYHGRRSYIRVKSYGHFNFSKLPLFNFKRLDIS